MISESEEIDRERNMNETEKHRSVAPHMHPPGDQTRNLGTCSDREPNLKLLGAPDDTPTADPRHLYIFLSCISFLWPVIVLFKFFFSLFVYGVFHCTAVQILLKNHPCGQLFQVSLLFLSGCLVNLKMTSIHQDFKNIPLFYIFSKKFYNLFLCKNKQNLFF